MNEGAETVAFFKHSNRGDSMRVMSNNNDLPIDPPDLMIIRDKIRSEKRWIVKVKLIVAFHRKCVEERPKKRSRGKWKVTDTARSLGYSNGYVSEAINIIEFIEKTEIVIDFNRVTRELMIALIRESK